MAWVERAVEWLIFASRWLLAPFFLGLILGIVALLYKFLKDLIGLGYDVVGGTSDDAVIRILTMVDTTLIAILLLIIIFAGYENFVSKMAAADHEDRPPWMGKVGFADLKLKLIGAIVAISGVELLKSFLKPEGHSSEALAWQVGIHVTFVVSGVLFALTDYIAEGKKGK